jgi:hypothetical protein
MQHALAVSKGISIALADKPAEAVRTLFSETAGDDRPAAAAAGGFADKPYWEQ